MVGYFLIDLRSPHFGVPRYLSAPSQDLKQSIEFILDLYHRHDSISILLLKSSIYFRLVLVLTANTISILFVPLRVQYTYTSCG